MSGLPARLLRRCTSRATSSLPVPLSPRIEDGRVGRGHQVDLAGDRLQRRAPADQLAEGPGPRHLLPQVLVLQLEPPLQLLDPLERPGGGDGGGGVVGDGPQPVHAVRPDRPAGEHGQHPEHLPAVDQRLAAEPGHPLGAHPVRARDPVGRDGQQVEGLDRLAGRRDPPDLPHPEREPAEAPSSRVHSTFGSTADRPLLATRCRHDERSRHSAAIGQPVQSSDRCTSQIRARATRGDSASRSTTRRSRSGSACSRAISRRSLLGSAKSGAVGAEVMDPPDEISEIDLRKIVELTKFRKPSESKHNFASHSGSMCCRSRFVMARDVNSSQATRTGIDGAESMPDKGDDHDHGTPHSDFARGRNRPGQGAARGGQGQARPRPEHDPGAGQLPGRSSDSSKPRRTKASGSSSHLYGFLANAVLSTDDAVRAMG